LFHKHIQNIFVIFWFYSFN